VTEISTAEFMAGQSDNALKDAVRRPDELVREARRRRETPNVPEHVERRAAAAGLELLKRHEEHQRTLTAARAHQEAERGMFHKQKPPRAERTPEEISVNDKYPDLPLTDTDLAKGRR
jgi:hypothetical protein